jgi:hypothetical protein
MKVLGVDIGRRHTGIVGVDLLNGSVVLNETIDLPLEKARRNRSYNPQYYRLDQAQTMFSAFVKSHDCHGVVLVVLEDYIYPKIPKMPREGNILRAMYDAIIKKDWEAAHEQARQIRDEDAIALVERMDWDALALAEIHGVFLATLGRWGIPAIKVSPTQMKYFMTGNGKADKRLMIKMVYRYYKAEMPDEHQYDALAAAHIGRYFIQYCRKPQSIKPGYPRSVCNTIMFDKRFKGVAEEVRLNLQKLSEVTG